MKRLQVIGMTTKKTFINSQKSDCRGGDPGLLDWCGRLASQNCGFDLRRLATSKFLSARWDYLGGFYRRNWWRAISQKTKNLTRNPRDSGSTANSQSQMVRFTTELVPQISTCSSDRQSSRTNYACRWDCEGVGLGFTLSILSGNLGIVGYNFSQLLRFLRNISICINSLTTLDSLLNLYFLRLHS